MSDLIYLKFAVFFTGAVCIGCFAFFAWLLWSIFWEIYDHFMQERTRSRNNRFKPRSERDAYRFQKGVHR